MAVNTSAGLTERAKLPRIVQQGGGWSPMQCSNTIDNIGKKCHGRGVHYYMYKHMVRVLPLSMVDDILGISKCGNNSLTLNTFINTQIPIKKLKFHTGNNSVKSKCHKLHIGKSNKMCPELRVHGSPMQQVLTDTYLRDVMSNS